MSKDLGLLILAGAIVAVGVLQFVKDPVSLQVTNEDGKVQVVERTVGAAPGPDIYTNTIFHSGATVGSGCFSTSTTGTLTANQLERNSCIYVNATGAGQATLSLTLPASTTLSAIVPNEAGYCREWFVDNSDVAAATTTTIVAGTGWNLVGAESGAGTGADVIAGGEYGTLKACRETDGDIVGILGEYLAAD